MSLPRLVASFILCGFALPLAADEPAIAKKSPGAPAAEKTDDRAALIKKLTEKMNGVKLVGRFTVLGKDSGPLAKEEYTILSATKLEDADYWLLKARIKYGDHDLTVPLPLEIKWAGDTPVITLTNLTIPGLGTFSSRVVIHDDKYAGTWSHDKVGGHLFGTLEPLPPDAARDKPDAPKTDSKKSEK
jgi:hypothetical protein